MIRYGIFDENGKVVSEFETIEEGLEALKMMNDGEIQSYGPGEEQAYYTEHYDLVRGLYSRVCKGKPELKFKDGAPNFMEVQVLLPAPIKEESAFAYSSFIFAELKTQSLSNS